MALGAPFGGNTEHINELARERVDACAELRGALLEIDHAPTELVLTRQRANVSKLLYHMRIDGGRIDDAVLERLDRKLFQ